jgi:multidrug efflux system membrane fusion protein
LTIPDGCHHNEAIPPPAAPPIPVSHPVQREVTDYVDFTGRTDAVQSVSIRARVTGYLEEMPFQEGREVAKGDTLFTIDPRPYQAQYNQAVSQVNVNEASLQLARATLARDEAVNKTAPGAVSLQQLDTDRATVLVAEAQLQAAKANRDVYKLNLEFTKVTSPIDGMVSRYFFTRGNLVIQDSTMLTTVVSLDPIYAYFELDETTLVRIRQGINSGRIQRYKDRSDIPVYMGLQGEDGYPHQGAYNFINNVVNPSTGSIATRAKFDNPKPAEGVRLLSPGMFVRIHLPIGQPHNALLIIDRAISSDQGIRFVYVLDKDNKAQYRKVTTGALQPDGLRVIEKSTKPGEGLQPDDWVVVGGLPQVRPQMKVQPDRQPMPTLGPELPTESSGVLPPRSPTAPAGTAASTSAPKPLGSSSEPAKAKPEDSGKAGP